MAMIPGLMPSVTQAESTIVPISVWILRRSPVTMPSLRASSGWIHTGFLWASSYSHFALAERV